MQGDVIGEQVAARWGLAAHTAPFEMAALGKKRPGISRAAESKQRRVPGLAACPSLEGLRALLKGMTHFPVLPPAH